MVERIDPTAARRIALAAQGFGRLRARGRVDVRHFRKLMRSVGLLQLDSVNVIARSHYLPAFSRIGPYDRGALDRYAAHSRELFEYWGHEASLLPVEDFPLFRWRMESFARRPWRRARELMSEHPGYIEQVEEEIRERGPLTVSDFTDRGGRRGPWWGWGPGKVALEYLFATGRVSARRGPQFIRVYDLAERMIPVEHYRGTPAPQHDAYRQLLLRSARFHGVGTSADLADYYRLHLPTARPILEELAGDGLLVRAEVPGWRGPTYLHPEAVRARSAAGTALVSPFDPLVWNRDRALRLFDFHYRIEIYVPEPKRTYGYYVLPFLHDGHLVGRVDLKAHRTSGNLEVRSAHHEAGVDPAHVAGPLREELCRVAQWLRLDGIVFADRGSLMPALQRA